MFHKKVNYCVVLTGCQNLLASETYYLPIMLVLLASMLIGSTFHFATLSVFVTYNFILVHFARKTFFLLFFGTSINDNS